MAFSTRNNAPGLTATGTIAPARFVKIVTGTDIVGAAQCGAGDPIFGVCADVTKYGNGMPGYDATIAYLAGDNPDVYVLGDVAWVTAGATVTKGAYIKSDSTGRGIVLAVNGTPAQQQYGGIALGAAAVGELFPIWVMPGSTFL